MRMTGGLVLSIPRYDSAEPILPATRSRRCAPVAVLGFRSSKGWRAWLVPIGGGIAFRIRVYLGVFSLARHSWPLSWP